MERRSLLASTIYVDPIAPDSPDGGSWQSAYHDLQQALASAPTGSELRVADGTYYPTVGTNQTISFQLKSGVALRGGYAGYGVADPNARDTTLYPSILSGKISSSVQSYNVVSGDGTDPTAILDGFTVTQGIGYTFYGGGMRILSGSPTITGCTFIYNGTWNVGGGIYIDGGSPAITDCVISYNGGGIYVNIATVQITRCKFEMNASDAGGAGLYLVKSTAYVDSSAFVDNQVLAGASDVRGSSSNMTFRNSVFLYESQAENSLWSYASTTAITNCTFAPYDPASRSATISVISENASQTQIYNSIIWGKPADTASQVLSIFSTTSVSYSDIQNGWSGATYGGNISVDPQFESLGVGTFDERTAHLKLKPSSPCIDAGLDSYAPLGAFGKDYTGGPRIIDNPGVGTSALRVDMGAFEAPAGFGPNYGSMSPQNHNQVISIQFTTNQLLQSSLLAGELLLTNATTGQNFDLSQISTLKFLLTGSATWNLSSVLPDGNYTALLPAGSIQDLSGTPYAHDFSFNFYVLAGDANRDRTVDIRDLSILATNWHKTNRIFAQGDFNYDGTVDANDLGILSSHWQTSLPAPAPAVPTAVRAPTRTATRVIELI